MRARAIAIATLALSLTAATAEPTTHHATGTFAVTITPEAQTPATGDALPTARMAMTKTFSGGMTGTATGTMLSAGTPGAGKAAAYVAIDQFTGSVDGKAGGFLLLHRATMDKAGGQDMAIVIAPDTGTGALAGISGTLAITITGGVHHYDLTYALPH